MAEKDYLYPVAWKPLAPSLFASILDVPVDAIDATAGLAEGAWLSQLDVAATDSLTPDSLRRLAYAIERLVEKRREQIANLCPLRDCTDDEIRQFVVGYVTRDCLERIPSGWSQLMDVDTLLAFPGFSALALLDLCSAVDVRRNKTLVPLPPRRRTPQAPILPRITTLTQPPSGPRTATPNQRPRAAFPLDLLVEDRPAQVAGLWVVDHWDDLTPYDLPPAAAEAAMGGADAATVLELTALSDVFSDGWPAFVETLVERYRGEARSLRLTLERMGLNRTPRPTLAELGRETGLSRQRIQQLELPRSRLAALVAPTDLPALAISAHFALEPFVPWTDRAILEYAGGSIEARRVSFILTALRFPYLKIRDHKIWCRPQYAQLRALKAMVELLQDPRPGTSPDRIEEIRRELPGIDRLFDVEAAVPLIRAELGIAQRALREMNNLSLARKTVTYLRARGCPIDARELAAVVELGHWPFEKAGGQSVDPRTLTALAEAYPDLLVRSDETTLTVAEEPKTPQPDSNLGILYRIVADHGGPIERTRLVELAARHGVTANVLGALVHGSRAPCLLPLGRGLVGLVGRDDRGLAEGAGATPRNPLESSNALLLPEGWAVAVRIDDVNRDGWGLPLPLADTVGARLGRVIRLTDRAGELNAVLVLEPKVHSCTGIGIARLLAEVGAGRGDLACVIVRPPHYELVLRRAAELRNASSMGKLLWSCGLEPRLADSADVWIRLGRTIGAAGDRASVRARFVARGQDDLVALLDGSGVAARPHHSGRQWHYTAPLVADTAAYAVVVADTVRAAVGVAPSGHVPAPEEWVTDGGVLWREAKGEVTVSREAGESWHRWARAEHAARRAALAGRPWQIAIGDTGYLVDGLACDDLVTALEAVGDADGDEVGTVVERSDRPYPRGGLAFSQAERAARRNGLVALRADRERGFASDFADGIVDGGPTLLDALDRRGI